jgi:hypothetical protein
LRLKDRIGGRIAMVMASASEVPSAPNTPSSHTGRTPEARKLSKPAAVVAVVRNTGTAFFCIA